MTTREKELLDIALKVLELNKGRGLDLRLTGSLMLAVRGIEKLREAKDIDFLISEECVAIEGEDYCPLMPKGYRMDCEGRKSSPDAIKFINDESGVSIDFIPAYEESEDVNCVPCGTVGGMVDAKLYYAGHDKKIESMKKHALDLLYLEANNTNLF